MLAHLLFPPPTKEGMEEWSLTNFLHHQAINTQARAAGITIPSYIIYPVDARNMGDFLEQHQRQHQDMDAALGIAGSDLATVNFQDEKQTEYWFFLHYQEHAAAAQILGHGL